MLFSPTMRFPETNEWVECFFRPEVKDCLLDLRLADGRIVTGVRYCDGRLLGDEEAELEFAQWRFHVSP